MKTITQSQSRTAFSRVLATLAALAYLSIPQSSRLSAAESKISAPKTAQSGTPILIDGSQSKSTGTIEWIVSDTSSQVFRSPDNRQIIIICRSTECLFVGQRAIDSDKTEDASAVLIKIIGVTPGSNPTPQPAPPIPSIPDPAPSPAPVPSPAPMPVLPSSDAGKQSYAAAMAVTSTSRQSEAAKVISQLRQIQSDIRSKKINVSNPLSLRSGLNRIQSENAKLLGPEGVRAWSTWGKWFAQYIYDLYLASKLQTSDAWITTIEEIIKGLEAVR